MSRTITVDQFKSWLDGVEDMQPKNWVPDVEQWKKIRSKIKQLEDLPTNTEPVLYNTNNTTDMGGYGGRLAVLPPVPIDNSPLESIPIGFAPSSIDDRTTHENGAYNSPYK